MHPKVDFDYWSSVFPLESFNRPEGTPITSPADLCEVELLRQQFAASNDLGRAVTVDTFLWSVDPPAAPYLAKVGGVPHRESTEPWPTHEGTPLAFLALFCFVDSRDVVSDKLPGDVMLFFTLNPGSIAPYLKGMFHIEWAKVALDNPLTRRDCPTPSFVYPELSGHIHRMSEYPESTDVFYESDVSRPYLLTTTQSTKIGREASFVQNDLRGPNDELLCTLNSIEASIHGIGAKWPFIGMEAPPDELEKDEDFYGWGKYEMVFPGSGCLYFMINDEGQVWWDMQMG